MVSDCKRQFPFEWAIISVLFTQELKKILFDYIQFNECITLCAMFDITTNKVFFYITLNILLLIYKCFLIFNFFSYTSF